MKRTHFTNSRACSVLEVMPIKKNEVHLLLQWATQKFNLTGTANLWSIAILIVGSQESCHLQNTKTFLSTQCSYGNYSNCLPRKAILGIYNLKLYSKHSTFWLLLALVLFLSLFDVLQEGEGLQIFGIYNPCHFYRFSFPVDILHRKSL